MLFGFKPLVFEAQRETRESREQLKYKWQPATNWIHNVISKPQYSLLTFNWGQSPSSKKLPNVMEILSPNHWILPLKIIYLKILVFLENIPHPFKQSVKLSANISTDKAMKGNRSISDWFLFNFATITKIKHLQDLVVKSKVDNS